MTQWDSFVKRAFDVVCAAIGLSLFGWLILLAWGVMTLDTGCNGMFIQVRVGRYGHLFKVYTSVRCDQTSCWTVPLPRAETHASPVSGG